jgi:hypothetical protein
MAVAAQQFDRRALIAPQRFAELDAHFGVARSAEINERNPAQ